MAGILVSIATKARATVADAWASAIGDPAMRYRPEAHYMRGPGPKWRAKHAHVSARR